MLILLICYIYEHFCCRSSYQCLILLLVVAMIIVRTIVVVSCITIVTTKAEVYSCSSRRRRLVVVGGTVVVVDLPSVYLKTSLETRPLGDFSVDSPSKAKSRPCRPLPPCRPLSKPPAEIRSGFGDPTL